MSRSLLRRLATIIILPVTIGGFIYYFSSHPAVRHQLAAISPAHLGLIVLLYILAIGALSLVTAATLRLCNVRLSPWESSLLTMYTAVVNFFGPLQSGPAFRGLYLKRVHGLQLKQYTAATLMYYALFALFSGLFLLSSLLKWWLLLGIIVAALGGYYTLRGQSRLPLLKYIRQLHLGGLYLLAAATLAQISVLTAIYYVELRSVMPTIHLSQAIVYTGAANFSLFVSLTPGAIGFRESFLLFSQHLHHISDSTIIAANVIDRSMYIVLLGIIGLIIFGTHAQRTLHSKPDDRTTQNLS